MENLDSKNLDTSKDDQSDDEAEEEDEEDFFLKLDMFLNQPAKMAEKLPAEYKEQVLNCWQNGQQIFTSLQHPTIFISNIVQDLNIKLEESILRSGENQHISSLQSVLSKIKEFLNNQNLQLALQLGMFGDLAKKDLNPIITQLTEYIQNFDLNFDSDIENKNTLKEDLQVILKSLKALNESNMPALAVYKQKYIQTDLKTVVDELILTQVALDNLAAESKYSDNDDQELKKAISFWQETLGELEPLKALAGIKQKGYGNFKLNFVNFTTTASPVLLTGYGCYRKFTELYKADHGGKFDSWLYQIADGALRFSMLPIYFLKRMSEISQSGIGVLGQQALLTQLMFEFWGVVADPNFFMNDSNWPMRSVYRLVPAFAYYHGKELWSNKQFVSKIWDPENVNLKRALWFSLKDGWRSGANALESQVYKNVSGETLKKLEDTTLGLVKPGLISFAFNTGMPLLASNELLNLDIVNKFKNNVADLEKKDIFRKEFKNLSDIFDWNYVGNKDFKNISDAQFLEGRILGYASLSVGNHFGKMFTSRNKRPIKSILSKTCQGAARVLTKFGFLSKESLDDFENMKNDMKAFLTSLLQDPDDPIFIMARQMFFTFVVNLGFMSQLDVAKLEKEMDEGKFDDKKVELIIDQIVSRIVDTVIISVGGFVGSSVAWYGANHAMNKYGPFWPKITQEYDDAKQEGFFSYFTKFV